MTADQFSTWLAHMRAAHGWSERRVARELGCSRNSIVAWRAHGAPKYIGHACNWLSLQA